MARSGITYEQVAAVCDSFASTNRSITINSVREALGNTGSPNTVHRHLVKWRQARPVATAAAHELPATLVNAFGQELAKAAAAARAEIESTLVTAQQEAAQLSATGEVLEQQNADLQEQLNDVGAERDAAEKLASERQIEINHLTDLVQRERDLVGQAQTTAATYKVTTIEQSKEIEALKQHIDKLSTEIVTARARSDDAHTALAKAEVRLEVVPGLQDEIKSLRAQMETMRETNHALEKQVAMLETKAAVSEANYQNTFKALEAVTAKNVKLDEDCARILSDSNRANMQSQLYQNQLDTAAREIESLKDRLHEMKKKSEQKVADVATVAAKKSVVKKAIGEAK